MQSTTPDIYLVVILGMAGNLLLCVLFIFFYLRYKQRIYRQKELLQQQELSHQLTLLHATIQSQEKEQKRIGRDLHDEVGGALANLRLAIGNLKAGITTGSDVEHCRQLTDTIIDTVRSISHNLSPSGLEIFGLAEIVEELCGERRKSSGLDIVFNSNLHDEPAQLPADVSISLFRVLQELITNTIKHANAKQVSIDLVKKDNSLLLNYTDDGKGIDTGRQYKGIGLHNIESRLNMIQARYDMNKTGKGFNIDIQVPLT